MNEFDDYNGSLFGANPVFLQEEKLELASYQFCMQIYGGDFPEEFQDIFYLDDAIGYLFLSKEEKQMMLEYFLYNAPEMVVGCDL